MARQCSIDRYLCRFLVTDFPYKDNVWILANNSSQALSKGDITVLLDLNLVSPRHLIFDRVLDSRNVNIRLVEQLKQRVERCCLAGSRRADRQDHTKWF